MNAGCTELGGPTSEQKVKSVVGCWFCRNVAERETQVLPTGRQQDDMGSPGEVSEPVPGRLRRIRIREVNFYLRRSLTCESLAQSPNLTSIHLDEACAAQAKVRLARPDCGLARWSHDVPFKQENMLPCLSYLVVSACKT